MFNVPSIPKENSQEITDIISTIKTNIKSFSDLEVSPNVSIIPFRLFSSRLATAYRVARITYGWFKWITAAVGGILFICLVIKIVAFFASSRNEQAKRIHRVKSEPDSRVEVLSWSSMIPPKPCVVKSESTECHGGSKRVACMSTQSQTSSSFQATSTGQVRDLTNSEELILFLCTSSDQLSRSGRRSRTARESSPQVNFDTSAYEQLSKPDLLLIGRGLGIRKMPKGMNKAPLIVSVVEAYESVLLNFTEHEILGVLDILGAQNIEAQPRIRRCVLGKLEKIELVKLAVEIAF